MSDLKEKVCVVLGGAGSVGTGITAAFLQAGASVVVPSRSAKNLERLKDQTKDFGENLYPLEGDVGTEDGAQIVLREILDNFDSFDAVVVSLGGWHQSELLVNTTFSEWTRVLNNGLTLHFIAAKTFLPVLLEQDAGSYTAIAGRGGIEPVPAAVPVGVGVSGQLFMMRGLAAENNLSAVRINTLLLGSVATGKRGKKFGSEWITAREVGAFAAFLAADEGANVRGETLLLDGRRNSCIGFSLENHRLKSAPNRGMRFDLN